MKKCRDCKKDALNGYDYCEDHLGAALKENQDESDREAQYWEDSSRMGECDDS